MNRIIYSILASVLLLLSACKDSGTAHNCGRGCVKEATVLAFSECGGFADRNITDINMSMGNTYVEYNVTNSQKTIYLIQYNAAGSCEDIDSLGIGANFFYKLEIGLGVTSNLSCYCLRDVKMKIVIDHTEPIYEVKLDSPIKGENDPDIAFTINTEQNTTGIISFPRSVAPWKRP